jgi:N-formylglutamate amidohydrolase
MIGIFNFHEGEAPLLISVPHDGAHLPRSISERMTPAGRLMPDTDWHVAELYDFAREIGASLLVANYSRYVVDLNRPPTNESLYEGQVATGLCPLQTFAGEDIYRADPPDAGEAARRVATYWQPYHDRLGAALAAIREKHGHALLWDAHSIASRVPRLFDGELPELNIGTHGGRSCGPAQQVAVVEAAEASPFSHVLNGRFQGGFITRQYGDPLNHVHAVQLEIAQRVYMDEQSRVFDAAKATRLRGTLRHMLNSLTRLANKG